MPALTADDRFEIQQILYRYAWAIDTGDADAFVACFSECAVIVWDAFDQPYQWSGHDQLRAFVTHLRDLPTTAGRRHHVSNILIDADAGRVTSRSYVTVVMSQDQAPHPITVTGWYEDELARDADGWRIVRRTIRDWAGPILAKFPSETGERVARPLPPPLAALVALAAGRR